MRRTVVLSVLAVALSAASLWAQEAKLKVGDPAPALAPAKWLKGEPVKEFKKGRIYVVEFWATWCGPCKASIPHLSELQQQYRDVTFIGQDCWERDQAGVPAFVKEMGDKMSYRVALDDVAEVKTGKMAETWMTAAGRGGIPCAFVVGKDTKIAWIGHPMMLDAILKDVVAGKFDPKKAAAREEAQKSIATAYRAGGAEKALEALDQAAKADKDLGEEMAPTRFRLLLDLRRYPEAYQAAKGILTTHRAQAEVLNEVAWAIVDPAGKVETKDLDLAERLAVQANNASQGKKPEILDTLARVYFCKGQVDKAIAVQTQAVQKADNDQFRAALQKTLYEYKAAAPAGR